MAPRGNPALIFGGSGIGALRADGSLIEGSFSTAEEVSDLLKTLQSLGINRIDTAARYPQGNSGASERLLGEAGAAKHNFAIDTKIYVANDFAGSLEPAAIEMSLRDSRERLQLHDAPINVLFAHAPDPRTPLEAQAAGFDAQYKKGLFKEFGLSNFPPESLSELLKICREKGYVKPTVYQGQYNLVSRRVETTLFPLLREHGMTFHAFSPLAAGFLSGRLTAGDTAGTRFDKNSAVGEILRGRYDKPEMHDAIDCLDETIEPLRISKVEASLRWIYHHSALGAGDAVILGASKTSQLEQNLESVSKGPLPDFVVAAIDEMWEIVSKA
ncbi:NADP-dependent oxidoreductase domain-containing protein [Lasiosphaeria miniovina]|uniref:NADP-dependent oxidoreductase domain-containing protein n=1 Tax=Lasiosphaeria miniovina TaxID=1954250 RepID=A0AA40DWY4_9PEZI|nr:NADP-dependent oxidoreductase domain-containing protein [Lasiosphaeria miniovina]KAK0718655.1 NADP-dependent oxidoreductase domain-containing protein [Lasiosphaeria miniovina]